MNPDIPPHYILAMFPERQEDVLERLINEHLKECPGCLAWKDQHPGVDWRGFVEEKQ